jgi:adenylate cyclase
MVEERVHRRLAAILAADVVGYSRLMGEDEELTRARLRALHFELLEPTISASGGRIVKTMGDGFLVEFPSIVAAVRNALSIQNAMRLRNAYLPEPSRIELRVGVNLGDVIIEGNDIHGDGVNVAARLEGLCGPGEVYVSGAVCEQAAGKLSASFQDLGEHKAKNIARPIRIYRVSDSSGADKQSSAHTAETLSFVSERPSIAVLPFDNLSGDPEQEYFSDGMTEDLITDISKISGVSVASRNSSFAFKGRTVDVKEIARKLGVRYVVEGSVRKMGDRLRINAQLIGGADGHHLWAERYDGNMAEIFDFQDDIREQIVSALQVSLTPGDEASTARRPTNNLEAYDFYLKGRNCYYQYTPHALLQGFECLKSAIGLDPGFAEAYSYIAALRLSEVTLGQQGKGRLEEALEAAAKAVALDQKSAVAHTRLGWVQTWRSEFEAAEASFQKAISLAPENSEAFHYYNFLKLCSGDFEAALELREKTRKLNPFEPLQDVVLGLVRFFQGRLDEAVPALEADRDRAPNHVGLRLYLAAAYAEMGRADEAGRQIEAVRAIAPNYTVGVARKVLPFAPEDRDKLLDGLCKAGLPE